MKRSGAVVAQTAEIGRLITGRGTIRSGIEDNQKKSDAPPGKLELRAGLWRRGHAFKPAKQCRRRPWRGSKTSSHTSLSRGREAGTAVCYHCQAIVGPDQSMGPGGLATPEMGGRLRASQQQNRLLLTVRPGGRWGS